MYLFSYPPPAPGQPLSQWGGVVLSQEHCDNEPHRYVKPASRGGLLLLLSLLLFGTRLDDCV